MRACKTARSKFFRYSWQRLCRACCCGLLILPFICQQLSAVPVQSEPQVILHLQDKRLNEVSGMAMASDGSGQMWMLNDGGSGSILYRVGSDGKVVKTYDVAKDGNRDWEDMAAFNWHQQAFLLIADVGDNGADRRDITLMVIAEPNLKTPSKIKPHPPSTTQQSQLLPWKKQRIRYPQGARDCEAVAVDTDNDKVYLLSKRTQPVQLFSLSLSALMAKTSRQSSVMTLTHEMDLPDLSVAVAPTMISSLLQFVANWPTAMNIDVSQQRAVILTYGFLYFYQRQTSQTWLQAFAKPIAVKSISQLPQAESVTFAGKDQVWVGSEGQATPILSWQFPSP